MGIFLNIYACINDMNLHSTKNKGFTLVELIVVMVMIGILASIALMQLLQFKERSYNVTMQSDLRSAYSASKQFHLDRPNESFNADDLLEYGYTPTQHVKIVVVNWEEETLLITAEHPGTPNVFQVDYAGRVSKQ